MSRYLSFVLQSWQDDLDGTMHWKFNYVRNEEEIRFPDASFMIRTWLDDNGQTVRGLIRHVQSGQEMQFQSGSRAVAFIRAWMNAELSTSAGPQVAAMRERTPVSTEPSEQEGQSNGQPL